MAKTIMAVGAHIGDAQLTCGMLLAKQAMQGDRVVIVDLTAGERGTPAGWTTPDFRKYNVECSASQSSLMASFHTGKASVTSK